jgi:hypothetical protein
MGYKEIWEVTLRVRALQTAVESVRVHNWRCMDLTAAEISSVGTELPVASWHSIWAQSYLYHHQYHHLQPL